MASENDRYRGSGNENYWGSGGGASGSKKKKEFQAYNGDAKSSQDYWKSVPEDTAGYNRKTDTQKKTDLLGAMISITGAGGDAYKLPTKPQTGTPSPQQMAQASPVFRANQDPNQFGIGRGANDSYGKQYNNPLEEIRGDLGNAGAQMLINALGGTSTRSAGEFRTDKAPAGSRSVGNGFSVGPNNRASTLTDELINGVNARLLFGNPLKGILGNSLKGRVVSEGLQNVISTGAQNLADPNGGSLKDRLTKTAVDAPANFAVGAPFGILGGGGSKARGLAEQEANLADSIAKAPAKTGDVGTSVMQAINPRTGEKFYAPLTKKELALAKNTIDGTESGIAGIPQKDGLIYRLTAKTPDQMEAEGFKRFGSLDAAPQVVRDATRTYADTFNIGAPIKEIKPNIQPDAVSGLDKIGTASTTKPGGLIDKLKKRASDAYTKTIDRYNPLVNAGKQAGERKAVENALAGHYGATSTANYHIDFELKPVFDDVGGNINDFRSLLVAQRDAELAGRGIKGSDASVAGATIDKLRGKLGDQRVAELQASAQKLYDYQKNIVDEYLVKTGVISQEAADAMFAKNQAYVPFQRVMDTLEHGASGAPASVGSQSLIKAIKGSDKQIIDPIESIIGNTYRAVGLGKRNETAQTIIGLANKLPEGVISKVTKETPDGSFISAFKDGQKVTYAVPKEIADSAKALNSEQMNTIVKILAAPTRVFRATATGINPEFFLPNVSRDLQQAFITAGVNPIDFAKGMFHYLKKDDIYQDFLKSGGMTGRVSLDPKSLQKTVAEVTAQGGISAANPKRLYSLLEEAGALSEQPTRIAAFQKTLKKELKSGVPREEALKTAARSAQESSTNFARRGEATQAVNSIYAFMNARVQGTDKLIRSIKENPASATARLGMITIAPAIGLYAYNRQSPAYFDPRIVSEYDKQANFIIMAPWLGEDRFIKIPKGDVGRLANPIEAALSYADGKSKKGAIGDTFTSALSAFSPVQNVGDAIPTALRPPIETATNYNFFQGRNIVPDYKKNYPNEQQFNSNTPALYRAIGDALKQSPAKIQNLVEGYTTGIGKSAASTLSKFVTAKYNQATQPKGDTINQTPVARRFVGGAKSSREEYGTKLANQINALEYVKVDLKAGLNRGDISREKYDRAIQEIENEQNTVKNDAAVNGYGTQLEAAIRQIEDAKKQKAKDTRARNKQQK